MKLHVPNRIAGATDKVNIHTKKEKYFLCSNNWNIVCFIKNSFARK